MKSIETTTDSSCNAKNLNGIIFHYLLSDTGFSAADISYITTLAFSCPFREGDVVYTARSYYHALTRDTIVFNDDSICSQQSGKRELSEEVENSPKPSESPSVPPSILLFPNPANSQVNIVAQLNEYEEGILTFWNVEGQLVEQIRIPSGKSKTVVSTIRFSNGVYLYKLITNHQFMQYGKLTITR